MDQNEELRGRELQLLLDSNDERFGGTGKARENQRAEEEIFLPKYSGKFYLSSLL